jgi:hypothetical protein
MKSEKMGFVALQTGKHHFKNPPAADAGVKFAARLDQPAAAVYDAAYLDV